MRATGGGSGCRRPVVERGTGKRNKRDNMRDKNHSITRTGLGRTGGSGKAKAKPKGMAAGGTGARFGLGGSDELGQFLVGRGPARGHKSVCV